MLDLETQPLLDKHRLVGGCVRLPLKVDAERLRAEVSQIPASAWSIADGRKRIHSAAAAVFLRGHAPAEGVRPLEDRPALQQLPYVREIIGTLIAAPPLRCLLARLPPGATIPPHTDDSLYFWKSLRVHIAVETHPRVWMLCAGAAYTMQPGEVWVLNNCAVHAVWNDHETVPRTHLICDFLPSPTLMALLAEGERGLGRVIPEVDAYLANAARAMAAQR